MIFLQNHGVFVGGNSDSEIRSAYDNIISTLESYYKSVNVDPAAAAVEAADVDTVMQARDRVPRLLGG